MYSIIRTKDGKVQCIALQNSDGSVTSFGRDEDNTDYQEFLEWNAEQEIPLDLTDHPPPPPTPEELKALEDKAKIEELKRKITDGTFNDKDDLAEAVKLLLLKM